MDDFKRSIEEIILLYKLEPETKDIYVEGITDQLLFERFVQKNKLSDVRVIQVHQIDFSVLKNKNPSISRNNRAKLIALNEALENELTQELNGILIVIDRDFDDVTNNINSGKYLAYTDYNSLELYLYNSHTIDIFYKNCLHSFPITGAETINKLNPILIEKSLVRLTINKDGLIKDDKFTPFKKSITINKKNLSISFDPKSHILKILNNIKLTSKRQDFDDFYNKLKNNLVLDSKIIIRGHDFIDMFFLFIDKVKNDIGLTCDTFERSLFQCVDFSELKEEMLFRNILARYS